MHAGTRRLLALLGALLALACVPSDADELDAIELPEPLAPAQGVELHRLSINQGTALSLFAGGIYFGESSATELVSKRPALVTASVVTEPGFEARELLARLSIFTPGASAPEFLDALVYAEPEREGQVEFELEREQLVPGSEFSFELWEVDPDYVEPLPPSPPSPALPPAPSHAGGSVEPLPSEAPQPEASTPDDEGFDPSAPTLSGAPRYTLPVSPDPMSLRVVLVPIEARWRGCETRLPSDDLRWVIRDSLLAINPTSHVEVELMDHALALDAKPASLAELLPALQQARLDDGAAANVYYYGMLDACSSNIDGLGGLAFRAAVPAEPEADWQRVAVGLYWPENLPWTKQTVVHELGHLQGLQHVDCPGPTSTLQDSNYPHAQGSIGAWGFNVLSGERYDPASSHDYMSYCYDGAWTSDWTWAKTFARIRELSREDYAQPQAEPDPSEGSLLVGIIDRHGAQHWYTLPGRTTPRELEAGSRARLGALEGRHEALPDGAGELLYFELDEVLSASELPRAWAGASLALDSDSGPTRYLQVQLDPASYRP